MTTKQIQTSNIQDKQEKRKKKLKWEMETVTEEKNNICYRQNNLLFCLVSSWGGVKAVHRAVKTYHLCLKLGTVVQVYE